MPSPSSVTTLESLGNSSFAASSPSTAVNSVKLTMSVNATAPWIVAGGVAKLHDPLVTYV